MTSNAANPDAAGVMNGNKQRRKAVRDRLANDLDYANLKFQPIKIDLTGAGVSLSAWLERAKHEYFILRFAVSVMEKNDIELADCVREAGAEVMLHLYERLEELRKTSAAETATMTSTQVRIMSALSRVFVVGEGEAS